jgi:hypothetical protein
LAAVLAALALPKMEVQVDLVVVAEHLLVPQVLLVPALLVKEMLVVMVK